MAIVLDQIVPWGRSCREYELMFDLCAADLSAGVLDCGGGPASFVAEMAAKSIRVVSVDPIYAYSGAAIAARFEAVLESMLLQVRTTPEDWTWGYHRDPEDLGVNRRAALKTFLADYENGFRQGRYVAGELPALPLDSDSFGLTLCSHLLFLYSDLLSERFHVESALELCRVAREVRIFPLLTLSRAPAPHLDAVRAAVEAEGWSSEVVSVRYELQRGGNQMLKVFRRSA